MDISLAGLSLSTKVGYVYDERMLLHSEHDHDEMEETPARIRAIHSRLTEAGLVAGLVRIEAVPAEARVVARVHAETHVERLRDLALDYSDFFNPKPRRPGVKHSLGRDTYDNEHTSECIFLSCGGLLEATKAVASGRVTRAFANIRPPGHHASANRVDGFCFVNNVAVAAQYAIEELGMKKVMILDWDVHHGNGTQEIFAARPDVLFISIHRYDNAQFYPHTRLAGSDFSGTGAGLGFSFNVAWNSTDIDTSLVTDGDYKAVMDELILPLATEFSPEMVFVSCGFDAMEDDPLGGMHTTPWAYAYMTEKLTTLAHGRIVVGLEGGYHMQNLAAGSEAVVRALLDQDFNRALYPQYHADEHPSSEGRACLDATLEVAKKHWVCLLKAS